ncbi:MAG: Ig-like domain-containing protein [Candidatus Omnitrophica bacterium]|nr:Ig-like domain-containing protein [Candidatus Omnitrophota bacterium]MDD5351765.1 Ig-like domain-containing protein [Candidatus Omnitrophota bacterium]MDD5550976.1 Ig-like domain-containing protein [Candidatus Omnitrophota bacterium]
MRKTDKKFSFLIFVLVGIFLLPQYAFCASTSNTYEAVVNANSAGVVSGVTSAYDVEGLIGQALIGTTGAGAAAGFLFDLGFMYAISGGVTPSSQEYEIYDIQAFSDATKEAIAAATWQTKNDPYFTWKIKKQYPVTLILGYSVALDEQPDDIIDTTEAYYDGFAKKPVSDGRHVFFVKAATSGGVWGPAASFEFWIDTKEPEVENMEPASGVIIANDKPEITFKLSDSNSGIDVDTINFFIDNGPLSFEYKDGNFSCTPPAPLQDGNVTAHIQVSDLAGNSLSRAWGFIVDSTPPMGTIIINGGEESTSYARVRLNLEAFDETTVVKDMIISNDGIFDTETWQEYEPLVTDWVLGDPQQIGEKTVYCMFKDEAGNISSVYSDEIRLLSAAIDTIITSGPYSPTKETGAQFKYISTFDNPLFSYKLDTGEWSDWSNTPTVSFSSLAVGNHIFSVKSAKDLNGDESISSEEEDPLSAQWTWVITSEEKPKAKEKVLYWKTQ